MSIKNFIDRNYHHFNAASLKAAAQAYSDHLDPGGKMMITLGGAMSTAELGITLAEMIRQDKVQAISCTGANLEEDIFNLVAHDLYEWVPHYRSLSAADEIALRDRGMNRVTDTCIPEEEAMFKIDAKLRALWQKAEASSQRYFPYQYFYQLIETAELEFQIDPKNSWLIAAYEKKLPIWTPGWEDSSTGNSFVADVIRGDLKSHSAVKSGTEQMQFLIDWYKKESANSSIGFFQIGGGIAGDFPICVVPLIRQDLKEEVPFWGYFCQISDSTTSYGSYSGAVPNEKITWAKLAADTPSFIIESDATIVAPLIFSYVLESC